VHRKPTILGLLWFLLPALADAQSSSPPVATINGRIVTASELDSKLAAQLRPLEEQIYGLRRRGLEQIIIDELLRDEADRLHMTVEDLKTQIQSKATVTDGEIDKLVSQTANPTGDLDIARRAAQVQLLGRARVSALQQAVRDLRAAAHVEILLPELAPEHATVNSTGFPTLGEVAARVTIIEFTDFQCPYCAAVSPALKKVITASKGQVKLVHRDFPLPVHPLAWKAAVLARCAGEQSKFWEYHDRLFDRKGSLSDDTFTELNSQLGLNVTALERCEADGKYDGAIRADIDEARRIGVAGTPTLIVNGVVMRGAPSEEALTRIVSSELTQATATPTGGPHLSTR
jgi:protein-disulfide isomerase